MLSPIQGGAQRVTVTGTATITIANYFGGVAFGSTNEFMVVKEAGMGNIVTPGGITATTIAVNNDSSPSGDTVLLIIPLVAR